jgi:hypothetical protein
MAQTQNTGVTKKRSVFLRVWESDPYDPEDDGRTHYYARVGRLEIEGWLYGADREGVKEFLGRVLKAEAALPEQIVRAVDLMVNYLTTGVQLGLTTVAASAGYDYNESEGLSFKVEMFYDDNTGWAVEVKAVHVRHSGRHILKKRVSLRPVTAEALRKVVAKVVRQAYNAQWGGYGGG